MGTTIGGAFAATFRCEICGHDTVEHSLNQYGKDRRCFWCLLSRDLEMPLLEEKPDA